MYTYKTNTHILTLLLSGLSVIPEVKVWKTTVVLEGGVTVEEVSNICEIQTLVAFDNIFGAHELPAANLGCLLKHGLSTSFRVFL